MKRIMIQKSEKRCHYEHGKLDMIFDKEPQK